MKYQLCLIIPLLFCLTSCEKDNLRNCRDGYHLGDKVQLPGGPKLEVVAVIDQFCPCDVVCGFFGNLQVVLQEQGTNRRDTLTGSQTVIIGTFPVSLGEVFNLPSCGGITPAEEFCFEIRVE